MPLPHVDESLLHQVSGEEATELVRSLISRSPDPQLTYRYVAELDSVHPELFNRLKQDPQRLAWLATIASLSRFLSDELVRHPEWLFEIGDVERLFSVFDYTIRLHEFVKGSERERGLDFALFRKKELVRIVLRDGLGNHSVAELTEEISNLADAILASALDAVAMKLRPEYGTPQTHDTLGHSIPAEFAVLAVGKLGGRELNYSSDIDLMFIHGGNGETSGPKKISNREYFKKLANGFTGLLSSYTAAGLCYRVDLRLRPEGSLGEVCVSLDRAKEYYAKRARDWERQMLIKARVAAGDLALGQELLDFLEPSIYSSTLDFTTIEDMSATRERISEKLSRKRLRSSQLNVKLAPGGIRDIEFLVQSLQRLHGARDVSVQHRGTLFALLRLYEKDLLSHSEHERLAGAYQFLRTVEHRLQLDEDRQTHTLPFDPVELERIARRMPIFRSSSGRLDLSVQLLQTLNEHLQNVQTLYDRIVHAQRSLCYRAQSSFVSVAAPAEKQPSPQSSLGISVETAELLGRIAPGVLERVRSHGFKRSEDVLRVFAESLSSEEQQVQLLANRPLLAGYVLQILEVSPFLSQALTNTPSLIEEVRRVADHPYARPAFEALASPLNDIGKLRSFFWREMFRILAASICIPESVFETLDHTSGLAEFLIARAYRIAVEQGLAHARSHSNGAKPFREPESEMMVVALGRLGMREFDLASDADLLFIIPDSESRNQQFWTRVAEHLIEILTTYGVDGPILLIDTRLRPNGREGVLVQTESNYVEYFSHHAEAWEGIAYMKARVVAGDADRATAFLIQLQQVDWRRYGQGGRSRQDLRQMRMRLQREQGPVAPLKAAEGGYYDADFILMYLRLKGAGMFFKSLNTPERIDVVEKMGHLERAGADLLLEATTFYRAIDHALRMITGRAEGQLPASGEELELTAQLVQLWTKKELTSETLVDELICLQRKMRELFDCVFA